MSYPGTNVPFPVWNPQTGFQAQPEQDILEGVIADYQSAFGGALNLSVTNSESLTTPQGQLASSESAAIAAVQQLFCFISSMLDPAYAVGRYQDAIGRIYFMTRNGAQPTVIYVQCNGATGTVIPTGQNAATVVDPNGNVYSCQTAGIISGLGYVILQFAANVPGPTPIPETVAIYQGIPGWDSASVVADADNSVGTNTETRAQFEQRREATVEANAVGIMGAIIGAVANIPGIADYAGYNNNTASPVTYLGVSVPANSYYICVALGTATEAQVGQAILSKAPPGIPSYGTTSVTAYDNNPLYPSPIAYTINFTIASDAPVLFAVNLVNSPLVPSNAAQLVQAALQAAFVGQSNPSVSTAGLIAPPRARITSTIIALSYLPVIQALGPWAVVRSIQVGSQNDSDAASFTGSISGTTLTVSSITGTIADGQTLIDANGDVPPGTTIVSGSGTSWMISANLGTITSEAMWSVTPDEAQTQINANQEPILYAANIAVTVS